jgi:hypothetical protein
VCGAKHTLLNRARQARPVAAGKLAMPVRTILNHRQPHAVWSHVRHSMVPVIIALVVFMGRTCVHSGNCAFVHNHFRTEFHNY